MTTNDEDEIGALLRLAGRRPAVPADAEQRVRNAVREEFHRSIARRSRTRLLLIAASVAVIALGTLLWMRPETTPSTPTAPRELVATVQTLTGSAIAGQRFLEAGSGVRSGDTIETARGSVASLRLGAATLRLDGDTRVRFDSTRSLSLQRGAVYFASEGQAGVVIRTPLGSVADVGTQFEVRLGAAGMRVRVREGRVDVRGQRVEAGEEMNVDARGAIVRRPIPHSGPEWEWVVRAAPMMQLEGQTLRGVLDAVAREEGLRVELADQRAGETKLHGATPLTPDEALHAALAASGLKARVENDRLIVGNK